MDYEEKYKQAIDRAVNLFVTNNISATAVCKIFPELNKSEEINYEKKYKDALQRAKHALDCDRNNLGSRAKNVLVRTNSGRTKIEYYDYGNDVIKEWWEYNITHWMPFQFPVKGGEE